MIGLTRRFWDATSGHSSERHEQILWTVAQDTPKLTDSFSGWSWSVSWNVQPKESVEDNSWRHVLVLERGEVLWVQVGCVLVKVVFVLTSHVLVLEGREVGCALVKAVLTSHVLVLQGGEVGAHVARAQVLRVVVEADAARVLVHCALLLHLDRETVPCNKPPEDSV